MGENIKVEVEDLREREREIGERVKESQRAGVKASERELELEGES